MSKISDVPPAPWLGLPEEPRPTPLVNRLFSEILGRVQELLGARWGGAWLSFEGDHIALNFSAVAPTAADQSVVNDIVQAYPEFPYPLNPIVAVSYSYEELVRVLRGHRRCARATGGLEDRCRDQAGSGEGRRYAPVPGLAGDRSPVRART